MDNADELIQTKLEPHVFSILTNFAAVINRYSGAPLIALFDCLATLAETMGERLRHQQTADLLKTLLSEKCQQMQDDDKRLLPLFECFEQVIHALGEAFMEPHICSIFERCTRILRGILDAVRADPKDGWT